MMRRQREDLIPKQMHRNNIQGRNKKEKKEEERKSKDQKEK